MLTVGKINLNIYKCISDTLITDEVIITDNQMQHILDRHPDSYQEIFNFIESALKNPDYIIKDTHKYTGLVIKEIKKTSSHIQIVLRICSNTDEIGYKNSIISCWKISDKRLQNYLRNKEILYKRE